MNNLHARRSPSFTRAALAPLLLALAAACNCEGEGGIRQISAAIRADPNPLSFGQVYLGFTAAKTLQIASVGEATLEVSSITLKPGSHPGLAVADEAFSLAPNATRDLIVRLTVDAIEPVTGAILIASNDPTQAVLEVPITAEGARRPGPAISVCVESAEIPLVRTCADPLRVDFGAVATGSMRSATIHIKNVGDAPLAILSASAAGGADPAFSFDPASVTGTLAPDEERTVVARVTPTTENAITAIFQITSDDLDRDFVPIVLTAGGIQAAICADPPSIDFGTTGVGQPVERSVTLTSCGRAPVTLTNLEIVGSAELAVVTPLAQPLTLAPNATHVVTLRYTPVDRGVDRGDLRVVSDVGSLTVALSGQTAVCDLTATPLALDFGALATGRSRTQSVVLDNTGAAACSVSGLTITGSSEFTLMTPPATPLTIAPAASQTLQVSYAPANAGTDQGVLAILSDDAVEPRIEVQLTGRRLEAGECDLTVQPDPIAFGVVPLGSSRQIGVQITNNGATSCTINSTKMSASSSPDFAVASGLTLPIILGGRSATIQVAYSPLRAGPQTGTLEIYTGLLGNNPPITVAVTGAASGPRLCINPNPVVFGTHPQGTGVSRMLSLTSCGTDAVVITAMSFAAPTSAEYSFASPPGLPMTIPAGSTTMIDLRYRGVDAGRDDGILRIGSNDTIDPTQDVQLVAATGTACGDVIGKICGLDGSGPVEGATVYVDTPSGRVSATTNVQGDFVLTCLPAGGWTVNVESGSWSTNFNTSVADGQITSIPGQQCLNPNSARVAVVWGEWDQMQDILSRIGVPFTFYDTANQADLLLDATEMAQYDIIFLNCGFDDSLIYGGGAGLTNLRNFVMNGGSVYASDYAYDAVEVTFPPFVDFYGDDGTVNAAHGGGNRTGMVDVVDPSLRAALGGRQQVSISSCCVAMDSADAATTVYLEGDRYDDGGRHPYFVGFQPGAASGTMMFTDFHNNGQPDIEALFRWLIARL